MTQELAPALNPDDMTEDQVLLYTRSKRMDMAQALTKSGVPTDKELGGMLLQTLDGLDRSSLSRLKIKAEENANKNNGAAAAVIAQLLGTIGSSKLYQMEGFTRREMPALPSSIPDPEIVEGELDTNPPQMDFDSFSSKFEPVTGQQNPAQAKS